MSSPFMGDRVLAYFGFPQAHEDDAEQAILAGLASVNTVANLKKIRHRRDQLCWYRYRYGGGRRFDWRRRCKGRGGPW